MEHNELFAALSAFQGEVRTIPFDSKNPHFNSKYASLAAIWESIRPILSKHGLSVVQIFRQETSESPLWCVTRLAHKSGQSIESYLPVRAKDQSSQAMGSGITYARRYGISAILGLVADEDDDANEAQAKTPVSRANGPTDENAILDFRTKIEEAVSAKELNEVAKEMISLNEATKSALREAYAAKMNTLKQKASA